LTNKNVASSTTSTTSSKPDSAVKRRSFTPTSTGRLTSITGSGTKRAASISATKKKTPTGSANTTPVAGAGADSASRRTKSAAARPTYSPATFLNLSNTALATSSVSNISPLSSETPQLQSDITGAKLMASKLLNPVETLHKYRTCLLQWSLITARAKRSYLQQKSSAEV